MRQRCVAFEPSRALYLSVQNPTAERGRGYDVAACCGPAFEPSRVLYLSVQNPTAERGRECVIIKSSILDA